MEAKNTQACMEPEKTFIKTEGGFAYHILTPKLRDAALVVLARAFCSEPVCSSVAEIRPEMKTSFLDWVEFVDYWMDHCSFLDWVEFVDYWMDHCSSNGLSVVAVDETNNRLAGAFIVRDLLMVPPGFQEKYNSHEKSLSPWMNFLWHMDEEATKKIPELGEPGKAVDLWFLGVHPDYRGNKIANHLTECVLPLIKKAGFKFGTIEATNAFTSKAAAWNKFTAVYEVEAKDWLWLGEPLYTNAKAPHGTWTFWVKDLQNDKDIQ